MRVEQAVFGERANGHALLACSSRDPVLDAIRSRTDAALDTSERVAWTPYTAGFRSGSAYVLMRTALDETVRRGGMVATHVLYFDASEAEGLPALQPVLALLPEVPRKASEVSSEDVLVPSQTPRVLGGPTSAVLNGLYAVSPNPVVWLGQEGFLEAIDGLWSALHPKDRAGLAFEFAFSPRGVRVPPSAERSLVVCTPRLLRDPLERQLRR